MMEALENPTPADIDVTVAKARTALPAYTDMLTFYEAIFKAQAEGQDEARPSPIPIDAQRATLFWKEGFPLLGPAELPVDLAHGADLLVRLCRAVEGLKTEPARSAATIRNALDAELLTAKTILQARLEKDPSRLDTMAAELSVRSEVLAFLADQSLTPSRVAGRRRIAAHLKVDAEWPNGYCPICGSPPALGDLEENGQRHLYCGFCWHRWPFQRVRCVQCGQADPAKLYYLHSDEEPAYRVDACDACRHYIKTVDRRRLGRPFFPPLSRFLPPIWICWPPKRNYHRHRAGIFSESDILLDLSGGRVPARRFCRNLSLRNGSGLADRQSINSASGRRPPGGVAVFSKRLPTMDMLRFSNSAAPL